MSAVFIIGLCLSVAVGLSLGLIGGGGSILTVPILVYLLGVSPHDAVGTSLAVVGATSLLGSYLHWKKGNVDLRGGTLFGAAGVFGAFVGAPLTKLFAPEMLLLIVGLLMLVISVTMLLRHRAVIASPEVHPLKAVAAGAGVGILTGFLGVGGGFLVVPALIFFSGLDMRKAVGTSLAVIFMNCIAGLVAHLGQGSLDWGLTSAVTALAVGGAAVGTILSYRLHADRLQKLFAGLVLGVAALLILNNYEVLLQRS